MTRMPGCEEEEVAEEAEGQLRVPRAQAWRGPGGEDVGEQMGGIQRAMLRACPEGGRAAEGGAGRKWGPTGQWGLGHICWRRKDMNKDEKMKAVMIRPILINTYNRYMTLRTSRSAGA